MPLYKKWKIGPGHLAAVWEITEQEDFFASAAVPANIRNERRRIEFLCGRFLLQYLQPRIKVADLVVSEHGKPHLPGSKYHFSITHSWPYVAVSVRRGKATGIDLQCWRSNMEELQSKFLSEAEQELFGNDEKMITVAWCIKEAVYKFMAQPGLNFCDHIFIQSVYYNIKRRDLSFNDVYVHSNGKTSKLRLSAAVEKDFTLAYIS